MKKTWAIALVCVVFHPVFSRKVEAGETPSAAKIREVLQKCVEKQNRAPVLVAGVIDKNGTVVVAWGNAEAGGTNKVDGDTLFEIGSVSKVFTTLLLQDMADRGEVSLDDPVQKFLPSSVTMPTRDGKEITLRTLATHSSGLPRLPKSLNSKDGDNPYADYTVTDLYKFLSSYKLQRNIGAKSEYSNLGMGLLGHVLSLKAGTNYESLVVHRVCEPLKMENTRITLTPELQARFATGHDKSGLYVSHWDLPTLPGAGALRSSANDLLKFIGAQMGLIPSPLHKAMVKTQTAQGKTGFLSGIGLAWQIDNDNEIIWHNGGTGGFRSYIGFTKNRALGVVVLANSENDVDDIGAYLLGARDDIEDFHAPKHRSVVHVDPVVYDTYAGRYQCSWSSDAYFTIRRDGEHLKAQLTGQPFYEVYPTSKTEYFYTIVEARLTFVPDSAGTVTHLVLHQNGADLKATKLK